jgi:hypothetical protein
MIEAYASDLATQMGIRLSQVTLVDGEELGGHDAHLLHLSAEGISVNALVFRADIENLVNGNGSDSLEVRLRASLSRLQMLLDTDDSFTD